tara:strand:+ start:217 stop:534 length:318 start_codon:yes stop_codon:yes gene_type:complete
MDNQIILTEFIEQIDYCLSLKFKEKWRYRFSTHFVSIFQDKVLNAMQTQRPLKMSTLISAYTKKHKYNHIEVHDFFTAIEIEEYYPLIFEDKKYIEQKPYFFSSC